MNTDMKSYVVRFEDSLRNIGRRISDQFSKMSCHGLTDPQYRILMVISAKGPYKVTELADLMGVKPSAITVMIGRLVTQGLVERKHQENDRRVVLLSTTDEGNVVVAQLKEALSGIIENSFGKLSEAEVEHMVVTLEKIARDLYIPESGEH